MPNGTWIRAVRAGEKNRGVNYTTLACHASVLTPYVRDHLAYAAQGIEELYTQLPPAISEETEQRDHWENRRSEYVTRICKVVEHVGAALAALGCTDSELEKLVVCKDDANDMESDTHPTSSDAAEEYTDEEIVGSCKTITMELPGEGRTAVPETEN